ncbi:MAG: hypothetical protein MJK04_09235, partial [Psychrosphaera sp.]|nr:hypothetical protein [Psychrosphaera sp.]
VCMNQGNGRDERYSKSGDKGRGSARQQAKASKAVQSASKGVSNGAFKNNGGGGDKTQQPGRRGDGDGGEQRDAAPQEMMKKASSVLSNADLVKRGLEMTDTDIHLNSKTTKGLVISGGPPTIVTKTKISLTAKPLQGKNVTSISWLGVLGKVLKAGGMVTGVASGLNGEVENFSKFFAGASSPVAGGILAADGVVGLFYPGGAVSVVNDVSNGIEDAANRQLQSEGIHTDAQFIDSFLGDDYD